MRHSFPFRGFALIAASAYLLAVVDVVWTGHKPVCRLRDAVSARSAADRFSAQQDYGGAERTNLAALSFVMGCAPGTAARVAVISLGHAAAAFGQRQYFYVLDLFEAER